LHAGIGYNNYRHFVLLLLFLMLGCWYGISMLLLPFYEPLRQQIREKGFHWTYENGTGFLDLPTPTQLLQMIGSGDGLPVKIVVDLVYPLLLGVGAILSGFLGFHVQYMIKARTTLEHKIILQDALVRIYRQGQQQLQQISSHTTGTPALPPTETTAATSISTANNPFDQGYYKNLQQILGHNLLWILLPVSISLPAPYIPSKNTTADTPGRKTTTTTRSRKDC
jgi:DHHC palmitoyltransferase